MDAIQHFRLSGTTEIEEIACDQVDGENVIYWEDITDAFPGAHVVKHGNRTVKKMRDSQGNRMNQLPMLSEFYNMVVPPISRIEPERIKYHPDVVLDVVLHAAIRNGPAQPSMPSSAPPPTYTSAISDTEDVAKRLQIVHLPEHTSNNDDSLRPLPDRDSTHPLQSSLSDIRNGSKTRLSFREVVRLAQKRSIESELEQQLVTALPPEVQVRVRDSINVQDALVQVIKDGLMTQPDEQLVACLQELRGEVAKNNVLASRILELVSENNDLATRVVELQQTLNAKQDEMKRLQIQALDRLALLQNSVKALLTQTYELHEYPIPRLFIVLPHDSSSWNPLDLLSNSFRLYFLCECGEHTRSTNSKIPHHIHLAKHEGYDVARPKEFFRQYGTYILTILQMLKFGMTVAGVAVPALSQLIRTDAMDETAEILKELTKDLEPGVDQVISYIEKVSEDEVDAVEELSEQMTNNEALEGADLRQLESFLKKKDENRVLGNLYRTVTTEGHVKWVCIDHYRENYHEKAAQALRDTVATMQGKFDENTGCVNVHLRSRVQAEQFFLALEKARSVYELRLDFHWDMTQSEHKRLRDALAKSNVGLLTLKFQGGNGPASDIVNRAQRYDPIFDMIRRPSIQSVRIESTPENFIRRSSLQSRRDNFPNIRHLDMNVKYLGRDIPGLKSLIAKTPNLSSLTLRDDNGHLLPIYSAIADHQTYPITFTQESLCIPPPKRDLNHSMSTQYYMEHLFKVQGEKIEKLELDWSDDSTVDTVTKVTRNGSFFKELHLKTDDRLSDSALKNINSIVARSELRTVKVWTKEDEGRIRILESIQWKHLRELGLTMRKRGMEARVMKALVDGANRESGRIDLEVFVFCSEDLGDVTLAIPQDGLLKAFLSSVSLKMLALGVEMTLEEALSLLKSVDFSRMERISLWAKGFDSVKVEAILGCLQNAKELNYIGLTLADIADEQVRRMKAKGIELKHQWLR